MVRYRMARVVQTLGGLVLALARLDITIVIITGILNHGTVAYYNCYLEYGLRNAKVGRNH